MTARLRIVVSVGLVAAAALGGFAWWSGGERGALETAQRAAPTSTEQSSAAALPDRRPERSALPLAAAPALVEPEAAVALEPSAEEIVLLRHFASLRTIEVLVLEGVEPVRGARMIAHPDEPGYPPEDPLALGPVSLETVTDARGIALLPDVELGRYTVRVHWPPFPVQEVVVQVNEPAWRRTLVVFGSGTLVGTVYDKSGRPASGQLIEVSSFFNGPMGSKLRLRTLTDDAGRYQLPGLNAAMKGERAVMPYHASCELPDGSDESRTFEIGLGETLRLDFGASPETTRWTGRLLDTHGDLVTEYTPLRLVGASGVERRLVHDADLGFDVLLPPDEYQVSAWLWGGQRTISTVALGTEALQLDLVLPGTRLLVELEFVGNSAPRQDPVISTQAWLRADGGEQDEKQLLSTTGLRRVVRGLSPGRYWLTTWRYPLVGGPLPVDVTAEDAVLRVRGQVTDL